MGHTAVPTDTLPLRHIHPADLLHVAKATDPVDISDDDPGPEASMRGAGRAGEPDLRVRMRGQEAVLQGGSGGVGEGREGLQMAEQSYAGQGCGTGREAGVDGAGGVEVVPPVQLQAEVGAGGDVAEGRCDAQG